MDRLFADAGLARLLMFKGGTSLSKAYRLIERFSEDIDLILDWRRLSGEDPLAERSKAKQEKLNASSGPSAHSGRRRRSCTMRPTGPRTIRNRRAIRGIATIWPGWRRHR